MKKLLSLVLSTVLALSFASCGDSGDSNNDSKESAGAASVSEPADTESASDAEPSSDSEEKPAGGDAQTSGASPLDILNTVWNSYGEDDKFPVVGGDLSEENVSMDGPGKYAVDDAATMDSLLGFPAGSIGFIDDAASLTHMMNANTFTCGAYHVSGSDVGTVAAALIENILSREWICGFPDKLVVAADGDCVIAFFGANDLVDGFKDKLVAAYPSAKIISEDAIA